MVILFVQSSRLSHIATRGSIGHQRVLLPALHMYSFKLMCVVTDSCEPCPSNGECYEGKLECVRGYRKHGKLCIEDGDINEAAKKLVCCYGYQFQYFYLYGIMDGKKNHYLHS